MGQCREDFVELLVALTLAAFGTTGAPKQTQLELGAEDLEKLRSGLEACK